MNTPLRRLYALRGHALLLPLLSALLLMGATSCSSSRTSSPKHTAVPTEIPKEISLQTPEQRFSQLCASYADWQDVSMSVKASVSGNTGLSCSGKAAMRRGEWISLSLRMLGFEVASVWIDRDSVHAVDRYHKMYLSESISDALAGADVTIADLQDLLLGRAFLAGNNGGTLTDALMQRFTLTPSEEGLMIIPQTQPARMEYGFILSPDANTLAATSVGVLDKYPVTATYSRFTATRFAGTFASVVSIDFPARKLAGSLQWDFGSAKWNTGESRSWSTPKGYRRISGAELLRSVTSF